MGDTMQECIDNCTNCAQVCREALEYCREKGGDHADPKHLNLLEDCIKICELSANFMERESDNHTDVCGVCSRICEKCAEACEAMADGDEMMQKCADACRKCAESCRAMATAS